MFWQQVSRAKKNKLVFILLFVLAAGQILGLAIDGNLILHTVILLGVIVLLIFWLSVYNQQQR